MTYRSRGDNGVDTPKSVGQMAVTHPSPAVLVAVTGTGDSDLDPAVYPASFVGVLNAYSAGNFEGSAFELTTDGRMRILKAGTVVINAYADISHSANGSTVGASFTIERDAAILLTPRSVHAKLPNNSDIGNLSGGGTYPAEVGDIVGLALASDTTGNISIRSSQFTFVRV